MGIPAALYWSLRYSASAQKCGGVHKNIRENMSHGRGLPKSNGLVIETASPMAAAQPTKGGVAPAAPPMTIFWTLVRFNQSV